MPGEFETVDIEANALDAALGQDTDVSRTPHITALWAGLAAGGQLAESDIGDLIDQRQLVTIIEPPTVLSLGPTALYRAATVVEAAGALVSWPDGSGNGHNATALVGGNPNYDAAYALFGGLPAVTYFGTAYVETVDTFTATDIVLIAGFVSTAITGAYDVVVSLLSTNNAWIGRNDGNPDSWVAGVYEGDPFGALLDAMDGRPHVIAVRRTIRPDGTATRTAWLDGVRIAQDTVVATATTAKKIHIGGNNADGYPLTGAIAHVSYFAKTLTDFQIAGAMQDVWTNDLGQPGYLGSAAGSNLDQWGALIGQPRSGLTDEEYRRFISARPMANRSTGTIDELTAILATATGVAYTQTHLEEYFPASYGMDVIVPTAMSAAALSALGRLMEDARCMGIGDSVVVATGDGVATWYFGFLEDTHPEREGFGVGTWAVSV